MNTKISHYLEIINTEGYMDSIIKLLEKYTNVINVTLTIVTVICTIFIAFYTRNNSEIAKQSLLYDHLISWQITLEKTYARVENKLLKIEYYSSIIASAIETNTNIEELNVNLEKLSLADKDNEISNSDIEEYITAINVLRPYWRNVEGEIHDKYLLGNLDFNSVSLYDSIKLLLKDYANKNLRARFLENKKRFDESKKEYSESHKKITNFISNKLDYIYNL